MASNRIFYSVLERVGAKGNYQSINLLILSAIILSTGTCTVFYPFLFYQQDYKCQSTETNCKAFVCSLPSAERLQYIQSPYPSFASKFGDFRCEDSSDLEKIQTFIYIGGFVGIIVGAFMAQYLTNKQILICTLIANLGGLLLALFGPTLFIASVGLFINQAGKLVQMEIIMCYITESVEQSMRPKHIMVLYISFSMGGALNGPMFYYINYWQLVIFFYVMLPYAVGLIGLLIYTEQTPFDSIVNFPPEKAFALLQRIAIRNNTQFTHNLTIEEVTDIKAQYEDNMRQKHSQTVTFIDLFKFQSLRKIIIVSCLFNFLMSFQIIGPSLALKDYSLSIFLNGFVIGSSQSLGMIINYFMVSNYERKRTVLNSEMLALLAALIVLIFGSCSTGQDCPSYRKIIESVGLCVFRIFITFADNFYCILKYEAFPNQVRGIALQTTSAIGCIAIIIVPLTMGLFQRHNISIEWAYVLVTVIAIGCASQFQETLGIPPPEMIEEIKYQHHQVNDNTGELKVA